MTIMEIQQGNPYVADITITYNGVAYDLTGKTVFFTVKLTSDHRDDDNLALIKTITTHTDPTAGVTRLSLSVSQTSVQLGRHKYDFRVYNALGVQMNTKTGVVNIVDIVTTRTS